MNKILHDPALGGQSFADRMMAAKHSISGQEVTKIIYKATTAEVMGPKRKHLDYLVWCTTNPSVSIPQMANSLIERTHNSSWVVVYKALITSHDLINYGNERFTQFLASNNSAFNLGAFLDKTAPMAYDMSSFIRRYARYLNEKCSSYRQTGYDFCKVKRGKDDGYLRTLDTDKILKVLPILQSQLDVLLAFGASPHELNNGVIVVCFLTLFKDLIRLFACYNDGIINLLERYFEMNRKNAALALDIYKKFILRMEGVGQFLRVAEAVGIDRHEIPDLAKAPSSLLEALEEHLRSMDNSKKPGSVAPVSKPTASVTTVIRDFSAAAQAGAAPGAGAAGALVITEDERRRILEEEQRQLDVLKKQKKHSNGSVSMTTSAGPVAAPRATVAMETRGHLTHSESLPANIFNDNFSPPPGAPFTSPTPATRAGSNSPPIYTMPAPRNQQNGAAPAQTPSAEFERQRASSSVATPTISAPPPGYNSFGEILKPTSLSSTNMPPAKIDLAALMISSSAPGTMPTMQKGTFGQTSAPIIPMSPTYVIPMSSMYAMPGGATMTSSMASPYYMQPRIVMLSQPMGMMAPQWGQGPIRPMLRPQMSLPAPQPSDPFGAM